MSSQEKKEVSERELLIAMVAGDFQRWLDDKGRRFGLMGKFIGFPASATKYWILEMSEDAIDLVKGIIDVTEIDEYKQKIAKGEFPFRSIEGDWIAYSNERKILTMMIADSCLEWLKGLGDEYGEMAKQMGIPSTEGKLKMIEILYEAIKVVKQKDSKMHKIRR